MVEWREPVIAGENRRGERGEQSWIHFRFVSTGRKRPPAGKPCYYGQPLWVQMRFQWIQTTGLFHVYLPNQTEIGSKHIYELTFRKFQKLGRLASFAVVFLIETSFPFYEWYKLRLFSFNTITVIYIYKGEGRRVEGVGGCSFQFWGAEKTIRLNRSCIPLFCNN